MKIAAAQTIPKDGIIDKNISDHYRLSEVAAEQNCKLILFPEMSLTGYMREGAHKYAFTADDNRLNKLMTLAHEKEIIIAAGAPVIKDGNLYIGTIIIQPNNTISLYTKQFLHDGEETTFIPCNAYNPTIEIEQHTCSFAICADISNENHINKAKENNTTIYCASLFYTETGIEKGVRTLEKYSEEYHLNILMANYADRAFNLQAGGYSSFWKSGGKCIKQANAKNEELLIVDI